MKIDESGEGSAAEEGAESILEEVGEEVKAFIQNAETTLLEDVQAAGAWLKNELEALAPEIVADLKAAVSSAVKEVAAGTSAGDTVANVLTILARDGVAVLAQVKSDVVTAVVGLTSAPATK